MGILLKAAAFLLAAMGFATPATTVIAVTILVMIDLEGRRK